MIISAEMNVIMKCKFFFQIHARRDILPEFREIKQFQISAEIMFSSF